jgi:hypothetical protein
MPFSTCAAQRVTLTLEQLPAHVPLGQKRIEPMARRGIYVQLSGDSGRCQQARVVHGLVAQWVEFRARDQCACHPGQFSPARGNGVGIGFAPRQVGVPHQQGGRAVDAWGCRELGLRRRRPVIENGLVQQLKDDVRRGLVSTALRQSRGEGAAGAASGDGEPRRVDVELGGGGGHPFEYGRQVVQRCRVWVFRREPVVHRDDRAGAAPGELNALQVVYVGIPQHERSPVAVHHGRCRRRPTAVDPHRNRLLAFTSDDFVANVDSRRVDCVRGVATAPVQRLAQRVERF